MGRPCLFITKRSCYVPSWENLLWVITDNDAFLWKNIQKWVSSRDDKVLNRLTVTWPLMSPNFSLDEAISWSTLELQVCLSCDSRKIVTYFWIEIRRHAPLFMMHNRESYKIKHIHGGASGRIVGLGWPWFWQFHCLADSALTDGNLAELAVHLGKMVEHQNQSQPNYPTGCPAL